jgi:hypothetical protein
VLYTVIFSEPRYRLPIFMFLLPLSALALRWLVEQLGNLMRNTPAMGWRREAALATGFVVVVFAAAPALAWMGERLREHHRWAASECVVAGRPRFCSWRTLGTDGDIGGVPGVAGVWNGVGIALPRSAPHQSAAIEVATELPLEPGDYGISATLDVAPVDASGTTANGTIVFFADDKPLSPAVALAEVVRRSQEMQTVAWRTFIQHKTGPLRLRVRVEVPETSNRAFRDRVWLSDLRVLARPGS